MAKVKYMTVQQLRDALAEFPKSAIVLEMFEVDNQDCTGLLEVVARNGKPCLIFHNDVVKP